MTDSISNVKAEKDQEKRNLSWNQYLEDIEKLCIILKEGNYKSVYGIPRAGIIIATIVSYKLNIPLKLNEYDIDNNTIIINEIVDSGNTMKQLLERKNKDIHTACLHYKINKSCMEPTYYINKVEKDEWIVYPYEPKE